MVWEQHERDKLIYLYTVEQVAPKAIALALNKSNASVSRCICHYKKMGLIAKSEAETKHTVDFMRPTIIIEGTNTIKVYPPCFAIGVMPERSAR